MGVEPTIRPAKGRIAGFEGREDHRTLFASASRNQEHSTALNGHEARLAGSSRELGNALCEFDALGIQFVSLHEGVDTSTPNGRLVFGTVGWRSVKTNAPFLSGIVHSGDSERIWLQSFAGVHCGPRVAAGMFLERSKIVTFLAHALGIAYDLPQKIVVQLDHRAERISGRGKVGIKEVHHALPSHEGFPGLRHVCRKRCLVQRCPSAKISPPWGRCGQNQGAASILRSGGPSPAAR